MGTELPLSSQHTWTQAPVSPRCIVKLETGCEFCSRPTKAQDKDSVLVCFRSDGLNVKNSLYSLHPTRL